MEWISQEYINMLISIYRPDNLTRSDLVKMSDDKLKQEITWLMSDKQILALQKKSTKTIDKKITELLWYIGNPKDPNALQTIDKNG